MSFASRLPGAGGSAMPCGLVLPAARAKATSAAWLLPLANVAAALYWYTRSVPLSTIQMLLTLAGSIVMPVGLVAPAVVMVQLLTSDAAGGVLEHLVRGGIVHNPQIDSVGHDVFGTGVAIVQTETAGRILTAGEA